MLEGGQEQPIEDVEQPTSSNEPEDPPLISDPEKLSFKGGDNADDDTHQDELSFSETFWDEWNRVWRAFAFVIKSWIRFPGVA